MKSNSERETALSHITSGRPFLSFLACAILLSIAMSPPTARAAVSITEMARLEASDTVTQDNTLSLFRGYLSLGLLPEAASLLERRVRMGNTPAAAAAPLFDALVDAQSRFDAPERLIAVCETAIRSGVRTPLVIYFYGTALRSVRGRQGEASAVLARVNPDSPYHLLALYSSVRSPRNVGMAPPQRSFSAGWSRGPEDSRGAASSR